MKEEMWLARDKNETLWIFSQKPKKQFTCWIGPTGKWCNILPNLIFPEVKWSDKEPTKVKLVIENNAINKLYSNIDAIELLSEVFMLVSPSLTNSEAFNYASTILCELDKRKETRN